MLMHITANWTRIASIEGIGMGCGLIIIHVFAIQANSLCTPGNRREGREKDH